MSTAAKSFIKKSLQKNPDKRVTIEELLKDAFLGEHANFH
jgi:serine/threonine protein kinase